jgi:hypothetical protein
MANVLQIEWVFILNLLLVLLHFDVWVVNGIAGDRVQQFGERPRQEAFAPPGILSQRSGVFPAWVLPHLASTPSSLGSNQGANVISDR